MDKEIDKPAFLRKRGWVKVDVPHVWEWRQPPVPGLYTLSDAYDLQVALDNAPRKPRKTKGDT